MAPRRKGLPVHGWLIFDKPRGMTSTQAVTRLRHLYGAQKAGHAGTLDPLATGVLVLLLGRATKLSGIFLGSDKTYEGTLRLGIATDSHDAAGAIDKPMRSPGSRFQSISRRSA